MIAQIKDDLGMTFPTKSLLVTWLAVPKRKQKYLSSLTMFPNSLLVCLVGVSSAKLFWAFYICRVWWRSEHVRSDRRGSYVACVTAEAADEMAKAVHREMEVAVVWFKDKESRRRGVVNIL